MKFVHKFEEVFGGTILAAMTIITFLAAVNRFTFNFPMPWSEEAVKFLVMNREKRACRNRRFCREISAEDTVYHRTGYVIGRSIVFNNILLHRIPHGNKAICPEVNRP